ncbi:hypothetical protein [Streptomyces sp. NPDC058371]|jgi:hypothetical protein|uniref:hypothetical protein n=1 Tax=Streptomyces sp. NPDC058371 TaxID=3346463 RepID=UPI00365B71A3
MDAVLTAAAYIVLIIVAALVIHRLNAQHDERIALHSYSPRLPGTRHGSGGPGDGAQPPFPSPPPDAPGAPAAHDRRDHRDGGRGRFRPRRRTHGASS